MIAVQTNYVCSSLHVWRGWSFLLDLELLRAAWPIWAMGASLGAFLALHLVSPTDGKNSPQEALEALERARDALRERLKYSEGELVTSEMKLDAAIRDANDREEEYQRKAQNAADQIRRQKGLIDRHRKKKKKKPEPTLR
ncbi:hypothetical protein [Pseudovibrio sp. Ad37]|uniref:hypothetical protein n=1 Tax=Pseudovibrio sp. Ad37 TaxID=989422 RepID=UPI0007AEAD73|nr:hypothetical protein [Pseudovibrio sp. Ad37]KZL19915.1 hypothetical protein PsAD37_03636 [Pseudovibrio sp. Ad37]